MIPLFRVFIPKTVDGPLLETLHSGMVGQGPRVDEFEARLKERAGTPYVVTVNSGTSALQLALRLANVGQGDQVISTPMTCLSYLAPVLLADGKTRPIGKIVNGREQCEVVSFNEETGHTEPRRVTNWIKLPTGNVEWYRLYHKNNRASRGPGGKAGVFITGDHRVLTKRGLVRVDELLPDDAAATIGVCPNARQQELIDGAMLGDGHIGKAGSGWARFSIAHATTQREWLELKESALRGMPLRHFEREAYKQSGPACGIETTKSIYWRNQRSRWYSAHGVKIVPDDIELTPLVLASWYMDDGSREPLGGCVFCTEGFSHDEVWKLFWKLHSIGFHPRVYGRKRSLGIRILAKEFFKFCALIGQYVPPSMRYKLLPDSPPYDPSLWDLGDALPQYDTIVARRSDPPASHKPTSVYCLEVEDNHNFVVAGIVVSNCTASNMPILAQGASIAWADINPRTGEIDPDSVTKRVGPMTKAVVAVAWGGYPCNLGELDRICKDYGLALIQDNAHALGAEYHGKPVHNWGRFSCYSFQAIKHLTTIDGGMLICRDAEDYRRAKLLRWYGIDREDQRQDARIENDIPEFGYKWHMNDVNATIGLAQLGYIDWLISRHRDNAAYYDEQFWRRDLFRTSPLEYAKDRLSSYWLYTVLVDNPVGFRRHMADYGVQVSPAHKRNDGHTCFADAVGGPLPGVDEFAAREMCIPVGWWLSDGDRKHVMDAVEEWDYVEDNESER